MIEETLYTRLSGFAGLTALVGVRVYPNRMPQDVTLPAVSYRRVASGRERAMGANPGIVRARFQVDAWAATYAAARNVREQIRLALERWNTTTGTTVDDVFVESDIDLYEDDTKIHHLSMDFEVIYRE